LSHEKKNKNKIKIIYNTNNFFLTNKNDTK